MHDLFKQIAPLKEPVEQIERLLGTQCDGLLILLTLCDNANRTASLNIFKSHRMHFSFFSVLSSIARALISCVFIQSAEHRRSISQIGQSVKSFFRLQM